MEDDERLVQRAWRRTAVVVLIAATAGGISGWATSRDADGWLVALAIVTSATMLAGIAGMLSLLPASARASAGTLEALEGLERTRHRLVRRAVHSGVPLDQSAGPELQHRALTLARGTSMFNGLVLAQNLLLFLAIAAPQVARLFSDDAGVIFTRVLLVVFVVEVAFLVPFLLHRGRRARRYVAAATAQNERRFPVPAATEWSE
jgi:hypothetical protein